MNSLLFPATRGCRAASELPAMTDADGAEVRRGAYRSCGCELEASLEFFDVEVGERVLVFHYVYRFLTATV